MCMLQGSGSSRASTRTGAAGRRCKAAGAEAAESAAAANHGAGGGTCQREGAGPAAAAAGVR